MQHWSLRKIIYASSGVLLWLSVFIAALVGSSLKLDSVQVAKLIPFLGPVITSIQTNGWWLLIFFSGIAGITRGFRSVLGDPWVRDAVGAILEELRKHVFVRTPHDTSHYDRVTLFKRTGLCLRAWPWKRGRTPFSGWLVPVLRRPGHVTQRTKTFFLASDEPNKAEGIAGQAWLRSQIVYSSLLPDLEINNTDSDIAGYARQSWLTIETVRTRMAKGQSLARSYCGIPIEVKGKPWGVIVLDSRRANGIKDARKNAVAYAIMAKFVGKLLERI